MFQGQSLDLLRGPSLRSGRQECAHIYMTVFSSRIKTVKTAKTVACRHVLSFDSTSPNSAHLAPSNLARRTDWMG